jgi:NaMN:DMB phosphoribosyltransferase
MSGDDATAYHAPAHLWFERSPVPTIGVGDGGNEIGMGKLAVETIAANIPLGGEIACRTATTDLLVVGVSNWGGYALAAGLLALAGRFDLVDVLDPQGERRLWAQVLPASGMVHSASGRVELAVDGLDWATYIRPLMWMYARLVRR